MLDDAADVQRRRDAREAAEHDRDEVHSGALARASPPPAPTTPIDDAHRGANGDGEHREPRRLVAQEAAVEERLVDRVPLIGGDIDRPAEQRIGEEDAAVLIRIGPLVEVRVRREHQRGEARAPHGGTKCSKHSLRTGAR